MKQLLAAALLAGTLAMGVSAAFAHENGSVPEQPVTVSATAPASGYAVAGDNSSDGPGYPINIIGVQNR